MDRNTSTLTVPNDMGTDAMSLCLLLVPAAIGLVRVGDRNWQNMALGQRGLLIVGNQRMGQSLRNWIPISIDVTESIQGALLTCMDGSLRRALRRNERRRDPYERGLGYMESHGSCPGRRLQLEYSALVKGIAAASLPDRKSQRLDDSGTSQMLIPDRSNLMDYYKYTSAEEPYRYKTARGGDATAQGHGIATITMDLGGGNTQRSASARTFRPVSIRKSTQAIGIYWVKQRSHASRAFERLNLRIYVQTARGIRATRDRHFPALWLFISDVLRLRILKILKFSEGAYILLGMCFLYGRQSLAFVLSAVLTTNAAHMTAMEQTIPEGVQAKREHFVLLRCEATGQGTLCFTQSRSTSFRRRTRNETRREASSGKITLHMYFIDTKLEPSHACPAQCKEFYRLRTESGRFEKHINLAEQDKRTKKVKDILTQEGEVFGAMIQYRLLKLSMLKTLENGMNPVGAGEGEIIRTKEDYDEARVVLEELAGTIELAGWSPKIDYIDEDLDQYTFGAIGVRLWRGQAGVPVAHCSIARYLAKQAFLLVYPVEKGRETRNPFVPSNYHAEGENMCRNFIMVEKELVPG
ncbi:uncharacterized protein CDV56_104523 [Aspergillus thermomutatus]|uniref:Uncharacterized protein n=1 Tax=Aspergillus thermomutatus TaxID=41047 RepID=A0A397GU91_ASPTH|nr:uncharacterized protein CDV56_104523 [Aspergillus thermomutatus]RHZ53114.1 hypothetical protein CDV56_104523 [Aspergillus thermomutatus]